jgi:putative nucleotidyltransferase with HDIG domain
MNKPRKTRKTRKKENMLKIPVRAEADRLMAAAEWKNSGPWVKHSMYVAQAAEMIASRHPKLDPETAFVLGFLHDIGRQEGPTDMRHVIDGYHFLSALGCEDAARICLTHSFPIQDVEARSGEWDCSEDELQFVRDYLTGVEYDGYDCLIQLCDALASHSGFCLIEKRLVDVAMRRGTNSRTIPKWKAYLRLLEEFEAAIGGSIYKLLPGVVENTFGFESRSGFQS